MSVTSLTVLHTACARVGLDASGAEPIRLGENAIYRLPHRIVARIARPGQLAVAGKEIQVAGWLADHGVPAVQVVTGVDQPVDVDGRAVTFWRELPPHRHGTVTQVAQALRRLHDLPLPGFALAPLAPFVRLAERIDAAATLTAEDRSWLRAHLADLQHRYTHELPPGLPECVVHGDAWVGNVVSTEDGTVLFLDLERCSIGPPEWDLVHTAIKNTSFGWSTAADYRDFCHHYGHDVTTWPGFTLLRDIRELRMTCYTAQHPESHPEAHLRLNSLRDKTGPRPWPWTPAP